MKTHPGAARVPVEETSPVAEQGSVVKISPEAAHACVVLAQFRPLCLA